MNNTLLKRTLKPKTSDIPRYPPSVGDEPGPRWEWPTHVMWDARGLWSTDCHVQLRLACEPRETPLVLPRPTMLKVYKVAGKRLVEWHSNAGRQIAVFGNSKLSTTTTRETWQVWEPGDGPVINLDPAKVRAHGATLLGHASRDEAHVNLRMVRVHDGLGIVTDGHRMALRDLGASGETKIDVRAWAVLLKVLKWHRSADRITVCTGETYTRVTVAEGANCVADITFATVESTFPPYMQIVPRAEPAWSCTSDAWQQALGDLSLVDDVKARIVPVGHNVVVRADDPGYEEVQAFVGPRDGEGDFAVCVNRDYLAEALAASNQCVQCRTPTKGYLGQICPEPITVPGPGPRDLIVIMPLRDHP
ncbi:MAG: hypothetical protein ACPG4T_08735 [Nannocystaceae bacterium]